MKPPTIGIVIPAYNEEKRIGPTLQAYASYFEQRLKRESHFPKCTILVVINNTKDRTPEVVESYQRKFKNIKSINLVRGGKGYAVIEGIRYFLKKDYSFIGFVDADLSTIPSAFYELYSRRGNHSVSVASRWLPESIILKRQPFVRTLASRIFNLITRGVFVIPYRDTQCGAKMFSRQAIEQILDKILITKWAFDVNIIYLCKIHRIPIKEMPTTWSDSAESKVDIIRTSLKMLSGIIRLRIIYSPFRRAIALYDSLPEYLKLNHRILD
jgi:glycosyltransferase involved in cell wall biosynthesis